MMTKLRVLTITTSFLIALNAGATVRYVDVTSASPAPPYTNWATAASSIQDAVDAASNGD